MSETTSPEVQAFLDLPNDDRRGALEAWLAAQPDHDVAARQLARTLASMEKLTDFLDAEKLRFPLADAAERCTDREVQAELYVHASASSSITGELADLPYCYARDAVRANPKSEVAWATVVDSLQSDYTDFLGDDLEGWVAQAQSGELPVELVKRTIAGAQQVAKAHNWAPDEVEKLATIARQLP